jgi:pentapeptide MXKDX repeat protein
LERNFSQVSTSNGERGQILPVRTQFQTEENAMRRLLITGLAICCLGIVPSSFATMRAPLQQDQDQMKQDDMKKDDMSKDEMKKDKKHKKAKKDKMKKDDMKKDDNMKAPGY